MIGSLLIVLPALALASSPVMATTSKAKHHRHHVHKISYHRSHSKKLSATAS
jgi:hypothetical protein